MLPTSRLITGLCCATALGFGISVATPAVAADKVPVTLQGCVQKTKSGGHWLTNAMLTSGTNAAVGTTGTAPARAQDEHVDLSKLPISAVQTWNLEDGEHLDRYVNQKVQVMGQAEDSQSGDKLVGASGPEMHARDIKVQMVKVIGTCQQ